MPCEIPPDVRGIRLLTFSINGTPFLKVAGTSTFTAVTPAYALDTEYWYANTTSLSNVTTISMSNQIGENYVSSDLDNFFSGLTKVFTAPQTVSQQDWTQGTYSAPSGTTARLYKMADPDNANKYVGLVLVKDGSNKLVATVWYKTWDPSDGYVWQESSTPGQTWTLVTNGNNSPTLDPSYIQSGQTWYHIVHD